MIPVAHQNLSARQKGCWGSNPDRPKARFRTRTAADDFRDWLINTKGASPVLLTTYSCRYAPQGEPHYHVGHLPGEVQNYGRMPERGKGGKKRRHAR